MSGFGGPIGWTAPMGGGGGAPLGGGGGAPLGEGGAPEIITLEQVDLLKGSFDKSNIRFLQKIMKTNNKSSLSLSDLNTLLTQNTAYSIWHLCANYNSEFAENNFPGIVIKEHLHRVYSLGHGNMHAEYYDDADTFVISNLYSENLDKRIDSLKTTNIINETRAARTSFHYNTFSKMLETHGASGRTFSHTVKSKMREFNKQNLTEYIQKLERQIEILQSQLDEYDVRNEIENLESEKRDIKELIDVTLEEKSYMLKTYNINSLRVFNAQLSNTKEKDPSKVQDNGIIYIPQIVGTTFWENGLTYFCRKYLTIKSQNSDPDSEYYSDFLSSYSSLSTEDIIKTMIERRNEFPEYAWCIYKRPGARLGSLAYEIVKHYVRQSGSEYMKLLFYANFGFDNLVYKTSEVKDDMALIMRSTNNGEKLVEMITLLEIMSCCGPHTFVNSSCLTTAADKDDAEYAANCYVESTQESDFSQNSEHGYVPNTPPNYEPNSQNSGHGYVQNSQQQYYNPNSQQQYYDPNSQQQGLTLEDLAYENQQVFSEEEPTKIKRKQKHGTGRGNKSYKKKSRQQKEQGKIHRVKRKTVNKPKQHQKGGSRKCRRQKRKYTAKLH